jgi:hypothetical protein
LLVLQLGDLALSVGETERAVADARVEVVLGRVDLLGARARFRPEVARVGRMTAELEADQMILLVARRVCSSLRRFVYETGGRIVLVQPCSQIVLSIVACVTSGLTTPGVSVQLARTGDCMAREPWRVVSSTRSRTRLAATTATGARLCMRSP